MRLLAFTLLLALSATAPAADEGLGAEVYRDACAGCHGATGRGDGPRAPLLGVPVPDLTGLAARNDGVYDRARVVRLVDGREGLAAHGGPMPMYGGLLTGPSAVLDAADGSPLATTVPILAVVDFVGTLQVP